MNDPEHNPDDIFNILVASDIHLGYNETHPERGGDSFNTFEEILQIAQENAVDFILLGGDLFHDAKPSPRCLQQCVDLLRKYCLGDKPITFEFLSDQKKIFAQCPQSSVNYEDPDLNVAIPIFSVHGNHDEPIGHSMISSLDILSSAGLLNYFGKWLSLTEVEITPLLMQKGETRLAIFGLSHIKDARLCRLFQEEKVKVLRPTEHTDDWFNIFVLHQNRADRGFKNSIAESALPQYLDLVIWGHEHDCRIEPEHNAIRTFFVSQPGSSVATSLAEGEAITKKVGLLKVHKKSFQMEAIKLQTVRPFVFLTKSFDYPDKDNLINNTETKQLAEDEVKKMVKQAKKQLTGKMPFSLMWFVSTVIYRSIGLTGHPKQPKLPLIRLRVEYSNENEMFNTVRFGQDFEGIVANPSDMILLRKLRSEPPEKRSVLDETMLKDVLRSGEGNFQFHLHFEDYIKRYFEKAEEKEEHRLHVLSVAGVNEAIVQYVDKNVKEAIDEIIEYQTKRVCQHVQSSDASFDSIEDEIQNYRSERQDEQAEQKEVEEVRTRLESTLASGRGRRVVDKEEDLDLFADDSMDAASGSGRGRGRGRGRTARGARTPRAPRGNRGSRGRGRGEQSLLSWVQPESQSQSQSRRSGRQAAPNKRYIIESDEESD